jgi:hypothetical protein
MATNPKATQFIKAMQQQMDRIAVVALLCLFGAMLYMLFSEASVDVSQGTDPKIKVLADPIEKNPNRKVLDQLSKPVEIAQHPRIDQVAKYNMFDYKAVKAREAIEKETLQKFQQAKDAKAKGQNDEAKRLLREILVQFPGNQEAQDLLKELDTVAEGAATASVTPAPASPTATPAP